MYGMYMYDMYDMYDSVICMYVSMYTETPSITHLNKSKKLLGGQKRPLCTVPCDVVEMGFEMWVSFHNQGP